MWFSMPLTGRSSVTGGRPRVGAGGTGRTSRNRTRPTLAACSASAPAERSSTATRSTISDGESGRFLDLGERIFLGGGDRAAAAPVDDAEEPARLLDDGGAALQPVAAVGVDHPEIFVQRGAVEVAA